MKSVWIAAAASAAALIAPAVAQVAEDPVREGVEAWSRGDYWAAVEKWRAPAVAGNPDAQFNLGQAYKLGRGVDADLAAAEDWYRRAALQGHPQAEDNYGLALFQNGKRGEAVQWLQRSASRGEPRAQFVLGTMYFNGDEVERDWVRAYALIVRSSQAGLPQANQALAQMDRYISLQERQEGLALARRYEEEAGRPEFPTEFAGPVSPPARGSVQPVQVPPSSAANRPSSPAPDQLAQRPEPVPIQAPPPPAPPQPAIRDGGWRIQLGAFSQPGNARAMWSNVSGLSALSGRQPYYVRSGRLTKLLIGPYASRADANRGCAAMRSAGRDCLVVAP
ncbi:SPOR domain-containing protein [Sphingosinithalassobacter sp. CS137]|uniref:SPOR domain-containing protein n=1 Tax=Sphingosinithalassobacter sp. CS137 TaxID=2762748 RepID=UPI00165E5325|nr:SPOR domain-containing protein [Sphingosinithalassobacter sp. CS137]